jgi:transcription initiation factor TFIID TATA-box-binding protein
VKWEVVNLVMVAHTRQRISLAELAKIGGFVYDPGVYHGAVAYYRPVASGPRVSIFNTGQMIVAGRIDPKTGDSVLRRAVRVMHHHGLIRSVPIRTRIVNLVVLANFERQLNLARIASQLHNTIYEPEQFPGLIHRPPGLRPQSFTIFGSGKVIIAGINHPKSIDNSVNYLRENLEEIGA